MNSNNQINWVGIMAVLLCCAGILWYTSSQVDALPTAIAAPIPQTAPAISQPAVAAPQIAQADGRESLPRTINSPFGPLLLTADNGGSVVYQNVAIICNGVGVPQEKLSWWDGLKQDERLNVIGVCGDRGAW